MLEVLLGAVLAILTTISVEHLRKPKLKIHLAPPRDREYPGDHPARKMRYVTLTATHQPLPGFARWMSRSPALSCRGHISFHRMDGRPVFPDPMPLRWAGSQQPVAPRVLLGDIEGRIVDEDRLFIRRMAKNKPPKGVESERG